MPLTITIISSLYKENVIFNILRYSGIENYLRMKTILNLNVLQD